MIGKQQRASKRLRGLPPDTEGLPPTTKRAHTKKDKVVSPPPATADDTTGAQDHAREEHVMQWKNYNPDTRSVVEGAVTFDVGFPTLWCDMCEVGDTITVTFPQTLGFETTPEKCYMCRKLGKCGECELCGSTPHDYLWALKHLYVDCALLPESKVLEYAYDNVIAFLREKIIEGRWSAEEAREWVIEHIKQRFTVDVPRYLHEEYEFVMHVMKTMEDL